MKTHIGSRVLAVAAALVLLAAWAGWWSLRVHRTDDARASVEELVLAKQTAALESLVAAAEHGTLLDFPHVLVVVDQSLVQDLLRAALPAEGLVAGVQVRLDTAEASFGDGLALVRLSGKASWSGSAATADLLVFGGLEVAGLDPASGNLTCRVKVFGVQATRANVLGADESVRGLAEALTHEGLESVLRAVEIPVRVEDHVSVPGVHTRRVRIAAVELKVRAQVAEVKVFGGKLWVALMLESPDADASRPAAKGGA